VAAGGEEVGLPTALKVGLGLVVGAVLGTLAVVGVGGTLGFRWSRQRELDVKKDWPLAPVTAAARDLPPGTELAFEDLATRSIPKRLVTASMVAPRSSGLILEQRIQVPLEAGDPVLWGFFGVAGSWDHDVHLACAAAVDASPLVPKPLRSISEIRARLKAEGAR
jgi:hypothetical protein